MDEAMELLELREEVDELRFPAGLVTIMLCKALNLVLALVWAGTVDREPILVYFWTRRTKDSEQMPLLIESNWALRPNWILGIPHSHTPQHMHMSLASIYSHTHLHSHSQVHPHNFTFIHLDPYSHSHSLTHTHAIQLTHTLTLVE